MPSDLTVSDAYRLTGQVTGRPTNYRPEYVEGILELSERVKCLSTAEIAAAFHTTKDRIRKWRDKFPEFDEAVQIAQTKSEADMIVRLRDGTRGQVDVSGMFLGKVLYGWRDRDAAEIKGGSSKLEIVVTHRILPQPEIIDVTPGRGANENPA